MIVGSGSLKVIRDQDYGFTNEGVIGVNIERLWRETQDEEIFVQEFACTYAHEMLHIVLAGINLPDVVEEEIIRAMLGEPWDDAIEAMY